MSNFTPCDYDKNSIPCSYSAKDRFGNSYWIDNTPDGWTVSTVKLNRMVVISPKPLTSPEAAVNFWKEWMCS